MRPMYGFWAVGIPFDYNIIITKPDMSRYSRTDGPFKTLNEAKKRVREWIRSDRLTLSIELDVINKLNLEDL